MKQSIVSARHLASASKDLARRLARLRREWKRLSAALDQQQKRHAFLGNLIGVK